MELWLVLVGFAVYSAAPFLPFGPEVPGNPVAPFVVASVFGLMTARTRTSYWVTLALGVLTLFYPIVTSSEWLTALPGAPPFAEIAWVFLVPALLLSLMRRGSVRRFLRSPAEVEDEPAEL